MTNFRNYLIIDGKHSYDFNVYISGGGTFSSPEKSYEEVEVPGRNGTLFFEEGEDGQTYKNIVVSYEAFIFPKFSVNIRELRTYLLTRQGYFRLEDSYHPNEYRLATYVNSIEPDMHQTLYTGTFDIQFNCKPQRYFKSGEIAVEFTQNAIFNNKYYTVAKPLIRAYGTGNFKINDRQVTISKADVYTDIDCEIMDCYKGTTNCNANVTLTDYKFPVLKPGQNTITLNGISKLEITPRWWTL